MRLQILLIPLIQVALVESLSEVSGYLGENIILHSGADPSWNLSRIEWSIFSNTTWIATYQDGNVNTDHISQYKGRLSLNISSGDLMIHKLNTKDDMDYTVDLINNNGQNTINKIKLTVKRRLQAPTIETHVWVPSRSLKRGCLMEVHCSSSDEGAEFSWEVNPPSVTTVNKNLPDGNSALLFAFLNTKSHLVNFTCITSRKMETASNVVTSKCDDVKPQPRPPPQLQPRNRCCAVIVTAAFVGSLLPIFIFFTIKNYDTDRSGTV